MTSQVAFWELTTVIYHICKHSYVQSTVIKIIAPCSPPIPHPSVSRDRERLIFQLCDVHQKCFISLDFWARFVSNGARQVAPLAKPWKTKTPAIILWRLTKIGQFNWKLRLVGKMLWLIAARVIRNISCLTRFNYAIIATCKMVHYFIWEISMTNKEISFVFVSLIGGLVKREIKGAS
jgi:hypothetical protein